MLIAYCPFLSPFRAWNLLPGLSINASRLGAACRTISLFLACRSKDWKRGTRWSLNSFSVSRQANDLIIREEYYAMRNMSSGFFQKREGITAELSGGAGRCLMFGLTNSGPRRFIAFGRAKLLVCGENEDITICDIIRNNLF